MSGDNICKMNSEKVKLIIQNMELLVQSLKDEIQEPIKHNYEEIVPYLDENDIDEYYAEND